MERKTQYMYSYCTISFAVPPPLGQNLDSGTQCLTADNYKKTVN